MEVVRAVNRLPFFRYLMRGAVGLAAAIGGLGFLFALTLHVATFFAVSVNRNALLFSGHILLMAVGPFTAGMYKLRSEPYAPKRLPHWTKTALMFFFGYFLLNMVLLFVAFDGGSPRLVNGQYQLSDHGRLIRYITREDYLRSLTLELRFLTSGWLAGYAAILAYLTVLWNGLRSGFREISWSQDDWQ